MRRYAESDIIDAVVIGTGAGGAPILMRLAQRGLSVVALEAGRWWRPERDFATDEVAQQKLFWSDERLSGGEDPVSFGRNNSGVGVGGSTLHWTAYAPRAQPDDFRIRSDFGQGRDWPLGYDDLVDYYDEVESFIGVSGPPSYPWGPTRARSYPLAPLPVNRSGQLMAQGCDPLGVRTAPAPNAALSSTYYQEDVGFRPACSNRGFCQAGCSHGAKASADVTFLPVAVRAGAEIRPESFATTVECDRSGRLAAVVYVHDGVERRQRCRAVFLCAGAIESPRFLLINDLANSSGQVGRNFMAHPGLQVWGRFQHPTRPTRGIPGALISEDMHRPPDADFVGGYLLQSLGVMPVTYAGELTRGRGLWGEALMRHMLNFEHVAGINVLGECLPHADNRLSLSDELDVRGLPKPRIDFTAQSNERRLAAHAERIMREIWTAAGGQDLWASPRYAHTLGTCRMGSRGDDAVVDRDGRSFDVENLYVCDNSVYPSSLSVNPALTQMALSLRTADRFLGAGAARRG